MFDTHICTALETACFSDGDLNHQLEDHLRRMTALDADCPLDLSTLAHVDFPVDAFDLWS